jgi:hypothetical protein
MAQAEANVFCLIRPVAALPRMFSEVLGARQQGLYAGSLSGLFCIGVGQRINKNGIADPA